MRYYIGMEQDNDKKMIPAASKILLVDGHSMLNRAFYGLPDLTNAQGLHTGAVFGFLNILFKILDEERPDYLAVAFDLSAPTFRHKRFEAYKGTRKPMPPELKEQVPLLKEVLDSMGILRLEQEGLEADDILGTLAKRAQASGATAAILSGDRDLLQIADEHITIVLPRTKQGRTEVERFTPAKVEEDYGVTPLAFIELKALQGDTSDNIPGVPKVGEKTARELMERFGSIEGIYAHLDEITKKAVRESLAANRELCDLSKELATICITADVPFDETKAHAADYYTPEAYAMFQRLGFKQLLSRFEKSVAEAAVSGQAGGAGQVGIAGTTGSAADGKEIVYDVLTGEAAVKKLFAELAGKKLVGFQFVTVEPTKEELKKNPLADKKLLGLSVCADEEKVYFIPTGKHGGDETDSIEKNKSLAGSADGGEQLSFLNQDTVASESVAKESKQKTSEMSKADGLSAGLLNGLMTELSKSNGPVLSTFDIKNACAYFMPREYEDTAADAKVNKLFDTLLASYLLNPLKNDYTPEDVAQEQFAWTLHRDLNAVAPRKASSDKITSLIAESEADKTIVTDAASDTKTKSAGEGSASAVADADLETIRDYACDLALLAFRAQPVLKKKLEEQGMLTLFEEIEMPLALILHDMERIGIICKPQELREYSDKLAVKIAELEGQIYAEAGEQFNINSPKQLGEILFDRMGLPGGKKTKTGYSTAADVLEKLASDVPFVSKVLEYRGLTKLKSTYADALASFIQEDGRIHTVFHQTITATGRLSSSNPNLQNIPMRTEEGRLIRKVFVPKEGTVFTDADYSQIELRILAHMSDDKELIDAYHTGKDIHAITASKVFHVPFEEVTPLMRRNAKAVNFGIVYGISAFGLGNDLSISRSEAAEYMQHYFETYPGVKAYQEKTVAEAKEKGYTVTLFGRRRPMPELKSSNFMQRSFGERVAMNAPIQGTAADIMKIAMIRVWRRLKREKLASQVILQIHDELLIETLEAEREIVCQILKEEMEKAANLAVPLTVEAHEGSDWYEAK